ncbi:hypothetical protein RN001_011565 [Aquatica leii]|uniref:Peptidase metallopeptidase domain-containing protein n=1 Tax=Aquatica leii TaxID=1421715 RepID=A0AAN7SM28_9COLE|nr:hypothetical protein RN001_011565 [Aquatica leii]
MNALSLALILILCHLAVSGPLEPAKELEVNADNESHLVINYLVRYGYVEKGKSYNNKQVEEGLKKLQNFFSLPETGVADEATLELIKTPRCGVPDIITNHNRFVIGSAGFNKKHLTYKIGRYSPKLTEEEVDENVKLALEMWGVNSTLTFSKVDSNPDLKLDFVTTVHSDEFPFDGPRGVLAHAFYPSSDKYRGNLHYDEEEDWKILPTPFVPGACGIDFFSVSLHELGHALGLAHSPVRAAVMYPIYQYIYKTRGLNKDDQLGIYNIYAQENQDAINYLVQFGYVEKGKSHDVDQVKEGLKKLQNFFKLPETGVADDATLELMKKPRCGVADVIANHTRFVIGTPGFSKTAITYKFGRYSPKVSSAAVDADVKLALGMWGESGGLTFSIANSNADILLDFVTKVHNDPYPFDGPSGVLAHAFYPPTSFSGDVHFDEEEDWKIMTTPISGIDFFSVAVHELGHSLGLAHSQVKSAVMYPIYQFINKSRGLDTDDKLGIVAIYGLEKDREINAVKENEDVINYLVRFGYVEKERSYNKDQVKEGLKKLQQFFGLPVTGVVDDATLELIKKPRCGVPDIMTNHTRYVIGSAGFNKKSITYKFGRYSPKVSSASVDADVKFALGLWGASGGLTFSIANSNADILLDFVTKVHNDPYPFDGPSGVLAHAFYPPTSYSGDVHFDEEENWKIMTAPSTGIDFFSVAVHELGHSLGLDHSTVASAVMYPTYQYIPKSRGLDNDDKLGIAAIYKKQQ